MKKYGIINKKIVILKNTPSFSGETEDEVLFGMTVEILWEDVDDFYYVQTQYDYKGYLHESEILQVKNPIEQWTSKARHIIISNFTDILEKPSYNSKNIMTLVKGSYVILTGEIKYNKVKIIMVNGDSGWIRKEHIKERKDFDLRLEKDIRNELVENAYQYLGTQFRWGGKSPLGLDSSGLTAIVYLISEIVIWRDSEFDGRYFKEISRNNLKKGDLIFVPAHIALYVGDNKFIHASGVQGKVIISSFNPNDSKYNKSYVSRIVKYGRYKRFK